MNITEMLQSLWGAARQTDRLLRLHITLGADVLIAETLDGWEAVDGGGYAFELHALSADASLSLDALLGSPVLLELLCADSRSALRPFHGYLTAVERLGSNGGLVRYRLRIEPWLALLKLRQDSYAFRGLSVIDILDQIFAHYAQGVVVPDWQWRLTDPARYLPRSLSCQYQESDHAFVHRLLAEEGIFYWFEHRGASGDPGLGQHTLILADDNSAFTAGPTIRFHRADGTEADDSIQRWAPRRRWQTGQIARASWDYRTRSLRPSAAQAAGPAVPAIDDDTAGPYAYVSAAQAQQRAQQHLDARQVDAALIDGAGTARRLAPGQAFQLQAHPNQGDQPLLCLRVRHQARNNFDERIQHELERQLGALFSAPKNPPEAAPDFYRNQFTALPANCTYRPKTAEGYGLRAHPVPTVSGGHSAIVVGDGAPIHTDRDHRIKVQQHWQRGENAASRLGHPRGANAPADDSAGTWARVTSPLAGENWGGVAPPRVGQEVWVDYLEGLIDRPVVVGAFYNGQGHPDAPHNQQAGGAAGASGSAAAWFAGNGHAGVLSGFKSQDLATSANGSGGYRQLQFDDTPNQSHAQLATTDDDTALTLGHLKHFNDNQRAQNRGYGAELRTQTQGALRGGAGVLLSSAGGSHQLDAQPARQVLNTAQSMLEGLAKVAAQQQAGLANEAAPDQLPAIIQRRALQQHLAGTAQGRPAGGAIGGGEGQTAAWAAPALVAHGEDGLIAVTPQDQVWVSGADTVISAGADLNLSAAGQARIRVANGIALYTQGDAPAAGRPVANQGIALHAAAGEVRVQAQQGQAHFTAEKAVNVSSSNASVRLQTPRQLLLSAAGAYLRIDGQGIEIGAPGEAVFHGALKEWAAAASVSPPNIRLPKVSYDPKATQRIRRQKYRFSR